ncbi:MAG: large conductance mechanosensitive channel protein MscL [Ilumatobacteraceae bacterium]|jgi:large conductance mechanosensitive channel
MALHPIKSLLDEFKQFINRGNLLVVSIGFVMGSAFTGLVTALVENVIMPLVAIPFGKPNFDGALILRINDAEVRFGAFLTVAVTFVLVAFVLFLLLKVYNRAVAAEVDPLAPVAPTEVALLTEIRDELRARRDTGGAV